MCRQASSEAPSAIYIFFENAELKVNAGFLDEFKYRKKLVGCWCQIGTLAVPGSGGTMFFERSQ